MHYGEGYSHQGGAGLRAVPESGRRSDPTELPTANCGQCGASVRPWNLVSVGGGLQLCAACAKAAMRGTTIRLVSVIVVVAVLISGVVGGWIARRNYLAGPKRSLAVIRLAAKADSVKHLKRYVSSSAYEDLQAALGPQQGAGAAAAMETFGKNLEAAYGIQTALRSIELESYENRSGKATGWVIDASGKPSFAVKFELTKVGTGTDAYWQVTGISNATEYVNWFRTMDARQ